MIENSSIKLSKITEKDRDFYNQIYLDEELMKFVDSPYTIDESNKSFEITLNKISSSPKRLLLYIIRLNSNKQKIGLIGLRWNQLNKSSVEIGIIILKEHQGNNYANISNKLLINHAFENLGISSLIAISEKYNKSANKTLMNLGFKFQKQFIVKKSKKIKYKWQIIKEI